MNKKRKGYLFFVASLLILTAPVNATIMLKLDLADLTERADKIFRGTVTDVRQGTIEAGGGELPIVTYRLNVDELIKGDATEISGGQSVVEIRMVGSLVPPKADENGNLKLSIFRDVPKLDMGGEYVLFTTAESAVGLSVTVGLGQGAFKVSPVDGVDGQYLVVNEFNNAGLGLNGDGPVNYEVLNAHVRALLVQ